jgi:hypothetical protein
MLDFDPQRAFLTEVVIGKGEKDGDGTMVYEGRLD